MPRLAGSRVGVDGQAFSPAGGNSGSQSVGRDEIVEMRHLTLFKVLTVLINLSRVFCSESLGFLEGSTLSS